MALLVLGLLGLTTEFRHKTITPTLLATPNRWRLLAGKAPGLRRVRDCLRLICLVVNFAIAIIWLNAKGFRSTSATGCRAASSRRSCPWSCSPSSASASARWSATRPRPWWSASSTSSCSTTLLAAIPWVRKGYPFEPGGAVNAFNSNGPDQTACPTTCTCWPRLVGGLLFLVWCAGILVAGGCISLQRDIS